jgi:hypothetical protein
MTTSKKANRIRVPDRSKLADGVAQRREYARNYVKIGNAIDDVVKKHWGEDGNHFRTSIMAIVRELVGCRISEIGDTEIDAALTCVESTHHLIKTFRWHLECEYARRKWKERQQKERDGEEAACIAAMNRVLSAGPLMGAGEGPSKAPALSLVHDCGRDLAPRDFSPSGPYAS